MDIINKDFKKDDKKNFRSYERKNIFDKENSNNNILEANLNRVGANISSLLSQQTKNLDVLLSQQTKNTYQTNTSVRNKENLNAFFLFIEKHNICIINKNSIFNYLKDNSISFELLKKALKEIKDVFIENTITLSIYIDPEINDKYLLISIEQKKYDKEIQKKIKELSYRYTSKFTDKDVWIAIRPKFI